MTPEELRALVDAMGSMAELAAVFYTCLTKNNVPRKDAAMLTAEVIKGFIPMP